ncbi:MAG: hypothetical protein GF346_13400 [Candidatus Eisenbacteria bacterium]|nr:hypothetical protein [Candidatus Latescibacterota bacterium]MBD3303436.1 hypothetical protein [Candidatus Eisenbacteria bacterium]
MSRIPIASSRISFRVLLVLILSCGATLPATTAEPITDSDAPNREETRDGVFERVGIWPYGQSLAVSVDEGRGLAFVGSGGAVLVLDIEDLADPQLLSDSIHTLGLVLDACYDPATQRLFLACGEGGLEIWDVADPSAPQLLLNRESPGNPLGSDLDAVEVSGRFAIIDYGGGGIRVLDVSDPTHPVHVGGSSETGNGNFDIFLAKGGYLHAVGAQRYLRFRLDANGQLHVNGSIPDHLGSGPVITGSNDVAYMARGGEIWVLNPESLNDPIYDTYPSGYNISDMDVQGDYLYYSRDFNHEVVIVDVSNPYEVSKVGAYTFPDHWNGAPKAIELAGPTVHLGGGYSGWVALDASNPMHPDLAGNYETFSRTFDVERRGDYAYLAEHDDGVLVLDLTDLTAPLLVGQYDTPGFTQDTDIVENLLYVADADGGLRIADLSIDPTAPAEIGVLGIDQPYEVEVQGEFAYIIDFVIDGSDWLRIVDVSDPEAPVERGSLLLPATVQSIEPAGDHVYVAARNAGMRVIDVSDPDSPVETGSYEAPEVHDVDVVGDRAYLSSSDYASGFLTLDISDPENPALISSYNDPGVPFFDVETIGDFAYLTVPTYNQIYMLHLADEENPLQLGRYVTPGLLLDVAPSDSLILVPDGSAGLRILENLLYSTPGGGVGWEVLASGTTQHLRDVCFVDRLTGWVVGDDGTVLSTIDGGDHWVQQEVGTSEDLHAVHFADPAVGWIGGRQGVMRKTTNGGQSWTSQASGTDRLLLDLHFEGTEIGWAVCTGGEIRHTTDGGAYWGAQQSGVTATLAAVDFTDLEHGWIAADSDGLMLKTENGGASWSIRYLPTDARPSGVSFVDDATGWVCTSDASVLRTQDGGFTWTEQHLEDENPAWNLNDIQFVDPSHGLTVGARLIEGRSYRTQDGGSSWTEVYGAHESYLQALHLVDALHGWAVGHDGAILRFAPVWTSIPEEEERIGSADANVRLRILPNPSSWGSEVHFRLPAAGPVRLDVFGAHGRRQATLVDRRFEAGEHAIPWAGRDDEGRRLGTGVYFVRLVTDQAASVRKLVLLR